MNLIPKEEIPLGTSVKIVAGKDVAMRSTEHGTIGWAHAMDLWVGYEATVIEHYHGPSYDTDAPVRGVRLSIHEVGEPLQVLETNWFYPLSVLEFHTPISNRSSKELERAIVML